MFFDSPNLYNVCLRVTMAIKNMMLEKEYRHEATDCYRMFWERKNARKTDDSVGEG